MDRTTKPLTPAPGLLLNPRLPEEERRGFESLRPQLAKDHYWILSSGSTSARVSKVIGLSVDALRVSASAVNTHLRATSEDVWGLSLPTFHVGGLGILIRAELTGSRVADVMPVLQGRGFAEAAKDFAFRLFHEDVTLLSMVPTQIFDLVDQGIPAPPKLRAVVIGGAALAPDLYLRGLQLGWPLLPSFGMTECGSQIATAELASVDGDEYPRLRVLSHCEVSTDPEGHLRLRSAALLTGQFELAPDQSWEFRDPKVDGALITQDRVEITDGVYLKPLGRATDFVKIKGEGVNLEDLRERFFKDWSLEEKTRAVIVDVPDARDGARLVLAIEGSVGAAVQQRLQAWNLGAFPMERLSEMRQVVAIPRTELGKIAWAKLRDLLADSGR